MKRREKKWLIARRKGNLPIYVLGWDYRYTTKAKAQKEASKLNKAYRGSGIKFLV